MIENIHLVCHGHASRFEGRKGPDDLAWGHIPRGIIVKADDGHAGVGPVCGLDDLMEVEKRVWEPSLFETRI